LLWPSPPTGNCANTLLRVTKKTAQLNLLERTGSPCISCTETTILVLKDIAIEGRLCINTTAQVFTAEQSALSYVFYNIINIVNTYSYIQYYIYIYIYIYSKLCNTMIAVSKKKNGNCSPAICSSTFG
jgi:hypothetical protein